MPIVSASRASTSRTRPTRPRGEPATAPVGRGSDADEQHVGVQCVGQRDVGPPGVDQRRSRDEPLDHDDVVLGQQRLGRGDHVLQQRVELVAAQGLLDPTGRDRVGRSQRGREPDQRGGVVDPAAVGAGLGERLVEADLDARAAPDPGAGRGTPRSGRRRARWGRRAGCGSWEVPPVGQSGGVPRDDQLLVGGHDECRRPAVRTPRCRCGRLWRGRARRWRRRPAAGRGHRAAPARHVGRRRSSRRCRR